MEEWRMLASVAMLSVASVADLKSRSVSDWPWVAFGVVAAALYVTYFPPADRLPAIAMSVAVTSGLSFAVYKAGLFGGADALALSACQVLVNVARNSASYIHRQDMFAGFEGESTARKAVAFMVGFRSANPTFSFPMERNTDGGRRFDFAPANAEEAKYEGRKTSGSPRAYPFCCTCLQGSSLLSLQATW